MQLKQKLAEIRKEVTTIEKRGRTEAKSFKYDYVMGADVQLEIGTQLAKRNIILSRRNGQVTHVTTQLVTITCEYGFIDAESGEELWGWAAGEGTDGGDKGIYKAFTGALKYFLIQAFCLGMGDDPERDPEPPPPRVEVKPDEPPRTDESTDEKPAQPREPALSPQEIEDFDAAIQGSGKPRELWLKSFSGAKSVADLTRKQAEILEKMLRGGKK